MGGDFLPEENTNMEFLSAVDIFGKIFNGTNFPEIFSSIFFHLPGQTGQNESIIVDAK
jgi:hypothetical protein